MPQRPSICRQGSRLEKPGPRRSGWQAGSRRGSRQERGYDRDWVRLRAAKLAADPLCEDCLERGETTAATEVHHVLAFRGRDDPRRLEWSNLRSLCGACHQRRTRERSCQKAELLD